VSTPLKLNLGCGRFPMAGYVNVDGDPSARADVVHDLESFPYPFADGSAAEITASHVLEHLRDPFAAVAECSRILRPEGRLTIKVPHCSRGFTHPDHKRGFDVSFPLYFEPGFEGGYTGIHLICRSVRLRWFAQPWLKRHTLSPFQYAMGATLGAVFDWAARLSPFAASRLWCYWVGGFEEVEFVLEKPPPGAPRTGAPVG
jgi:SAM-dependent methyltransferase